MSTGIQDRLKVEELLAPITDLLDKLNDDSLRKSHTSVLISFTQMLDYIENLIKPIKRRDIRYLLETYLDMAQIYYAQFELSLVKKIDDLSVKSQSQLPDIRIEIEEERRNFARAKELFENDCAKAAGEHKNLIKSFPSLLQDALEKLRDEWQRIGTIAVASQTLDTDDPVRPMDVVAEVAAYSIGIDAQRIVVVPGKEFVLNFFTYIENFVVFTVPIYSVQAPWEWSIFWHELAGHQVRWLEKEVATPDGVKKESIESLGMNLRKLYDRYIKAENEGIHLLESVTKGNKFGLDYLQKKFSKDGLDLIDLGDFNHQFERILSRLPEINQFQMYESLKAEGWCVDWLKELFEDAWSVLTIRQPFLTLFQDILSRHDTVDIRHPSAPIRLAVASELLRLSQFGDDDQVDENMLIPQPEMSKEQKAMVRVVSKQLLRFLSLIIAANYKVESSVNLDGQNTTRQNAKVFQELQENEIDEIFEGVRNTIQKAIVESSKFHNNKYPVPEARKQAIKNTEEFKKSGPFTKRINDKLKEQNPLPSYEKLLKREDGTEKDYQELLELSFYDADYGVSNVSNVYYNKTKKFDTARLQSVPSDVTMGAIVYVCSGIQKRTSVQFWNAAAVPGFQI